MADNPPRRHERGHRDRQHGNLGREIGTGSEFVEHVSQCEFGEAASHKKIPGTISAVLVIHARPFF